MTSALVLSAAFAAAILAVGLVPAAAQSLTLGDTTYGEPQTPRDGTLIIEHPPVPVNPIGRRRGNAAAIAGFCRDAGPIERLGSDGRAVVRQREACDSVAPRTSAPGQSDPRPAIPEPPALRTRG